MKNLFDKIYLTWRRGNGSRRSIVGEISIKDDTIDKFCYSEIEDLNKAINQGFVGYPGLTIQPQVEYKDALKMFSSRLINTERNDAKDFLDFWEIAQNYKNDKLYLLAMTQGLSGTDNFEFLARFNIDRRQPFLKFVTDITGLQYYYDENIFNKINVGDKLSFELEPNNERDKLAVKVLFDNAVIGYIKKGHNNVFHQNEASKIQLEVKKKIHVNGYKQLFVKVFI